MRFSFQMTLGLVLVLAAAGPAVAKELHGIGQRVVDGDEFMLCEGETCIDIRLCGINTPSVGRVGYFDTVQALTSMVINQEVVCRQVDEGTVCDGRAKPLSRGRTVAQCFVKDGTVDVAGSLVSAGLGCDRIRQTAGAYSKDHPNWQCQ